MNIPVFIDVQYTKEDGYLTPEMRSFHDLLNQALQDGLSDNGWTVPNITAADLAEIESFMPNGCLWYESDAHELVVKINGSLRKITTTAYP